MASFSRVFDAIWSSNTSMFQCPDALVLLLGCTIYAVTRLFILLLSFALFTSLEPFWSATSSCEITTSPTPTSSFLIYANSPSLYIMAICLQIAYRVFNNAALTPFWFFPALRCSSKAPSLLWVGSALAWDPTMFGFWCKITCTLLQHRHTYGLYNTVSPRLVTIDLSLVLFGIINI